MIERESIRRNKLIEYLKKNLDKGYNIDSLKWALIKQGNSRVDVEYAIEQVKSEMPRKKVEIEKPEVKHEDYDFETKPIFIQKKPWWKFWGE